AIFLYLFEKYHKADEFIGKYKCYKSEKILRFCPFLAIISLEVNQYAGSRTDEDKRENAEN
ncbi:MAG: hypothetical protein ACP5KZ_04540, partial [bacterium]